MVDEAEVLYRWVCAVGSESENRRGAGCSLGHGLSALAVDLDLVLEAGYGLYGGRHDGREVVESESARDLQAVSLPSYVKSGNVRTVSWSVVTCVLLATAVISPSASIHFG